MRSLNTALVLTLVGVFSIAAPIAGAREMAAHDADGETEAGGNMHESRLSDEVIPPQTDVVPDRPHPTFELGDPFLGVGLLGHGIELPTGAVLRPSLLIFGAFQSALQVFDDGDDTIAEWANRLDVFANLQLTGTERILIGMRPLDRDGKFTSWQFDPNEENDFKSEFSAQISTLFFEGDFGEIFPKLDPSDTMGLDFGFAVGRQDLFFQEGMLINDRMDAIGVTRNQLLASGTSNVRLTALYAWDYIHRGDNQRDRSANLFGFFSETDFPFATVNVDLVYVRSDPDAGGDGVYLGISSIQRIGHLNTAFRALASIPVDKSTTVADGGGLLFSEISWSPLKTHNLVYFNAFVGIAEFVSAARAPETGGPLGQVGILFADVGLGRYGAPLGSDPQNAVGAALGYQMFFAATRRQLILELGGRQDTKGSDSAAIALGARYQQAFGQRHILQLDAFTRFHEGHSPSFGVRCEWRIKF